MDQWQTDTGLPGRGKARTREGALWCSGQPTLEGHHHHHHCVRPLVSGGLESLVGRAVQGCCVVHVVVVVVPSFCVGWLWSWSKMHLMLVAVVFRLLVLLENISLLYTLNSPTRWRTSHSSRTCCWVSVWLPHTLHVWV